MAIEPVTLTDEQKKSLIELEADIEALGGEIARAERAGINVGEIKQRYEAAKTLREGIVKEYVTG